MSVLIRLPDNRFKSFFFLHVFICCFYANVRSSAHGDKQLVALILESNACLTVAEEGQTFKWHVSCMKCFFCLFKVSLHYLFSHFDFTDTPTNFFITCKVFVIHQLFGISKCLECFCVWHKSKTWKTKNSRVVATRGRHH